MNEGTVQKPLFEDKSLTCVDCGLSFIFTAGEQSFYWSRNLIEPKRCPACRKFRKETAAGNNHLFWNIGAK